MFRSSLVVLAAMFCAFTITAAHAEDAVIASGKKVKFDYTLKVDGQVVESSQGATPIEFTQGDGKIIPGLSTALEGLKVGDKKAVTVNAKDAYGDLIPEAVKDFPKTSFPADFQFAAGTVVELQSPEGQKIPGIIKEVKTDMVTVDFNHPLAGKTLEFDVAIVDIQ
jgi:FKBP-type peptidyl-prolyl cis-trans isomerase 2